MSEVWEDWKSPALLLLSLGIGGIVDFVSLRITIAALAVIMLAGAVVLAFFVMKPGKAKLFEEEEELEEEVYVG